MPKKLIVLPLTEASIEMVKAEMGVMVMAKWALKSYIQNTRLKTVKVGRDGLVRKHYLATLKNKVQPNYFRQFVEFLQREITIE